MEKKNIWIISVVILLAALIVAGGMSQIARQQRTVTVRGLAERDVPADMADEAEAAREEQNEVIIEAEPDDSDDE